MIRSVILLAAAVQAAAAQDELTGAPSLTRPLHGPFTESIPGPKSTITMPVMGMQQPQYIDHPGEWYASVVGYDADVDATTLAAVLLSDGRDRDEVDITVTYRGPVSAGSYNTTENDVEYVCDEVSSANAMVCQKTSTVTEDTTAVEEDVTTVEGLSRMYVPVTLTAGLELLERGTEAPTSTSSEEGEDDDDDDGNAAGQLAPMIKVVVGAGIMVALSVM